MPVTEWYLKTSENMHVMQSPAIKVQVDPAAVSGEVGALGRVLILPYKLESSEETLKLLSIEGWIGWNSGIQCAVQLPIPSQIIWPNQSVLRVPITDTQIEAIEETRNGGVVNLMVCLGGLASVDQTLVPVQSSIPNTLSIERERWLTILQQLGAGTRRLVELPMPKLPRGDQDWAECMRLLDEATQLYRSGGYEHALKNCRSIVEGMPNIPTHDLTLIRKSDD